MTMKPFLNIGQFARVCHTTKETLLHYDRKGLLKPCHIGSNGYRRYSMKQFFDFDLIALLKETGSTLEEIKKYRDTCGQDGFLQLFKERISILLKEQERITHRLSMLSKLTNMGEEALTAQYDSLFFETKEEERILVYPVDSEKIANRESSVECYSACLISSIKDGNAIDPPLGTIIPLDCASSGIFRICSIFTANWNNNDLENAMSIAPGRYACLFHKGTIHDHEQAYKRMLQELSVMGLQPCSHVYVYDQMNYAFGETGETFIAKYTVKVAPTTYS